MKLKLPRIHVGDRVLLAAIALGVCAGLAAVSYQVQTTLRSSAEIVDHQRRLNEMQLSLYRLDVSRRRTVFDFSLGPNPDVLALYRDIAQQQGQALVQLRSTVNGEEAISAVDSAIRSYEWLLGREGTALNFALNEDFDQVRATLISQDYFQGINDMYDALNRVRTIGWREVAEETTAGESSVSMLHAEGAVLGAVVLLLAFLAMARLKARRDEVQKVKVERDSALAKVAHREREASANLVARSPLPAIEFEFPPAVKLVAWLKSRGIEDLERWLSLYPGEIRKLAPQFRIGHVSPSAVTLLKASDLEHVRDLDRWMPDRALNQCALAILRAIWNNTPDIELHVEVRAFDGAPRQLDMRGRLVMTKHGRPPVLIASMIDMTQAKRVEDELEAMRASAADASLTQNAFIASVNRDLRAPLDGVTGMAAALQRTRLDREQAAMLDVIVDAGETMRDTVNRALDFTNLEAGELEIAREPFDVGAMVDTVRRRFEPQATAKNLPLRFVLDPEADRWLLGDEPRIRQILSKLVSNAIIFTPSGEVEARISITPQGEGDELLTLAVRDTGPGMSEEDLSGALEDASSKSGGLALCRRLCEAMGGSLEVKSSADYGSTIVARIRTQATDLRAPTGQADPAPTPISEGRSLSVLAADDNAINRMVLKDMLEPRGVDLTLVENGADAIASWRARPFDVILLDLQMPVLSGYEVAREIRRLEADERRAPTPIIAVSASVMRSEIDSCLEAGMNSHIAKPIDPAQLFEAMRSATAKAAVEAQSDEEDGSGATKKSAVA